MQTTLRETPCRHVPVVFMSKQVHHRLLLFKPLVSVDGKRTFVNRPVSRQAATFVEGYSYRIWCIRGFPVAAAAPAAAAAACKPAHTHNANGLPKAYMCCCCCCCCCCCAALLCGPVLDLILWTLDSRRSTLMKRKGCAPQQC